MSNNIDTVINYFKYCVDGNDVERVSEYFSEDLCIFRPDCAEPITTLEQFKKSLSACVVDRYESIETTFQKIMSSEDEVFVALTHVAKGSNTWKGFDVTGKDVTWSALTYFRFNAEGKVVEEIVERNELAMAKQLGIVDFA
ncbi:ester cyclase [Aeromonas jandaei]|uniref:ester cyclase n=1 Tax=Aeromonas jandaei TaxID=650 RepID=UPI003BA3330A